MKKINSLWIKAQIWAVKFFGRNQQIRKSRMITASMFFVLILIAALSSRPLSIKVPAILLALILWSLIDIRMETGQRQVEEAEKQGPETLPHADCLSCAHYHRTTNQCHAPENKTPEKAFCFIETTE